MRNSLPASLVVIDVWTFANTIALSDIDFEPSSALKKIEAYAFSGGGAVRVHLPALLEEMGEYCFNDYSTLDKVFFTSTLLRTTPTGLFYNCANSRGIVFADNTVTLSIGLMAFHGVNIVYLSIPR